MYQNFDDEKKEKAPKNPFNRHILKGGQVDPGSKLYQRSVAGREKLDAMLQRLWSDGMDEADVFMAGVKALTSRDKGYVGAYLDAKNPGRRYQENEAMAITDQVMKDSGIGSHPGNRLTREKDEEGKAKRKEENISRGGFGPKQAQGAKAMSVRQQRKQGKRPSTGQPVEETDREGIADRETGPRSEWQNTLKDALEGKITAADVVKAFSKEKQSPLSQSPQAQAKKDQKTRERQQKMRDQIAEQKGLEDQEAAAGPEPEEEKPTVSEQEIINSFSKLYSDSKKYALKAAQRKARQNRELTPQSVELTPEDIESIAETTAEELGVDFNVAVEAINKKYRDVNIKKRGQDASSQPEQPPSDTTKKPTEGAAAGTKEPTAAPAETAAAPEPAEGAAPETEEAPAPAPSPAAAPSGGGEKPAAPETEPAEGAAPEPEAPAAGPSKEEAPKPAQRRRTRAETQEIQKRGSEELAKTQETNRKLEAMTKRMANSPLVKDEEMRDWINNDLERLLKSFTPAEKTEDPWEQDGPEATGIPEPTAQAPASQKALAGQPGPKGLLPPGRTTSRAGKEGPGTKKTTTTPRGGGGGRGQKAPEETQKPSRSKGKSPLDQVAKAVLSGIERDKAARESAGQFFNRVRDLIQKQAGRGASKSDVDQAAATAINQQKGRTTRNKARKNTVDSAEYQEFAQSIRSMMR